MHALARAKYSPDNAPHLRGQPPDSLHHPCDKPVLPSRRHSHVTSVAHERAMQFFQPGHATTQGTPRQNMATPTAEEHTSTVNGFSNYHV